MVTRVQLAGYEISIEPGSFEAIPGRLAEAVGNVTRFAVVTDSNLADLGAALSDAIGPKASLFVVPAGETSKSRQSWAELTDALIASGFARDSALIALGGGMIGDLAGFVAATFMRGIPWVNIPTSLLAMVDSSIGGKTGVDTPAGKNLVGAFHSPRKVFTDPQLLATLPLRHLRAGFAEIVKHGVIADAAYLQEVEREVAGMLERGAPPIALTPLIRRSVEIKAEVVRQDEYEVGHRRILNFGHTIGHAVESASGYALLHGEAIAIGMAVESTLAERAGIAEEGLVAVVERVLLRAGLPTRIPVDLDRDRIWSALLLDKKKRGGHVAFAVPIRPGMMAGAAEGWAVELEDGLIREVLR